MLALLKMEPDGATADSLKKLLIGALIVQLGSLTVEEIASKLLCFGVDGVVAFQGTKNGITKQIKQSYALPIGCNFMLRASLPCLCLVV
jgi:hypothetical protein